MKNEETKELISYDEFESNYYERNLKEVNIYIKSPMFRRSIFRNNIEVSNIQPGSYFIMHSITIVKEDIGEISFDFEFIIKDCNITKDGTEVYLDVVCATTIDDLYKNFGDKEINISAFDRNILYSRTYLQILDSHAYYVMSEPNSKESSLDKSWSIQITPETFIFQLINKDITSNLALSRSEYQLKIKI